MIRISFDEVKNVLKSILLSHEFSEVKASRCADIFTANSRDGVHSHGLNRFPVFIALVKEGLVKPQSDLECVEQTASMETYHGHEGPGMYNAFRCMERSIVMAKSNGISCVNVIHSNHWMRGATYGWQAAEAGCIGICYTNAIASMPPWGGSDPRLGNNPLVIAVPREKGHIVLDMALSMFSYGKMQEFERAKEPLPFPGGFDGSGNLTTDPCTIRALKSALPIGLWKGSGLALMLDILLSMMGGGRSTQQITASGKEAGLSQTFLCIYKPHWHTDLVESILHFTQGSKAKEPNLQVRYPGQRTLQTRGVSLREGIQVDPEIWSQITDMQKDG